MHLRSTRFAQSLSLNCRFAIALSICAGPLAAHCPAAIDDTAKLAPPTAVAWAEITQLGAIIDPLLAPSTYELLSGIEAYQRYLASNEYLQAKAGIALIEAQMGQTWQTMVRDLLGGGISLSLEPGTNSVILMVRSRNPELLTKLNATISMLIEADARNNGRPSPVQSKDYKGAIGYTFGPNEYHVILDGVLLISNQADALKAAVDRHLDPALASLAGVEGFQQARGASAAANVGWAWANLEVIRKTPGVEQALSSRTDNPLFELLLGGVFDAIRHAPHATLSLGLEGGLLRLAAQLPRDPAQTAANRSWYFAAEPTAGSTSLAVPGTIGNITLTRDMAGLWAAREELFTDEVNTGFAQADTQLGLYFSGRDFGPEVLGELRPQWQFVFARQQYAAGQPVPQLKLPAMALVLGMKNPDDFATQLEVGHQKIVGLLNVLGGQAGQPGLLLSTETRNGVSITKGLYVPDRGVDKEKAPINYNFSPSCARAGDHFIFGSTVGIVRDIVDQLAQPAGTGEPLPHTSLVLNGGELASILDDNRELLISQNMLSQGHGREKAEEYMATLLKLIRMVTRAEIRLAADPAAVSLETTVAIQPPAAP